MPELDKTPESPEEAIALRKLEKFLSAESFAIRYMNEGEYEEILKKGIPGGIETNLKDGQSTFTGKKDLLSGRKKDWSTTIGWDTNWGSGLSNTDAATATEILELMRECHQGIDKEKGKIREKFLLKFAEALEPYQSLNPRAPIHDMKRHSDQPIRNFRNDPLSYNKDKLREFLNHVSRMKSDKKDEMNSQYHILAVFSVDALNPRSQSWGNPEWKTTKYDAKPDDFLAAFSILPQKDLYQDMIKASSHAGELAHPIFDDRGILRWPLS